MPAGASGSILTVFIVAMSLGAVVLITALPRCASSSAISSARAESSSAARIRRPFFAPSGTSAGLDPKNDGAEATSEPLTTVKLSDT